MAFDPARKICPLPLLAKLAKQARTKHRAIVLCHGCFDIVHPGHLRYLQFAKSQGDLLVVSLTGDDAIEKSDGTRPYIPQELRAENLAAFEFVDHVVIVDGPTAEPVIQALQPNVYIKGKEYEQSSDPRFLAEKQLIESYNGRVIYCSGEVVFSSTDLLNRFGQTLETGGVNNNQRLATWSKRWGVQQPFLSRLLRQGFANKRVAVIGDAICDHYVFCDPAHVASEAPVLSVRPLEESTYLGGAAIVAAHLQAMGANPHLITSIGWDQASRDLIDRLNHRHIPHTTFPIRRQLPIKRRYLVETQKLLKVDQATPQPLDTNTEKKLLACLADLRDRLDAVIFTDFGCGTVTASLLEQAIPMLRPHVNTIVGDISGPQLSLLACREIDLLTPSERELRSVVGDFEQSLPTVAIALMKKLRLANLAVTMGHHGCVLFRPREDQPDRWFNARLRSQYLPRFAPHAADPMGAGDAFLAAATLALASDATLEQAGFVASAAAAIAVSKIGNHPISVDQLDAWLTQHAALIEPKVLPHTDLPRITPTRTQA